MQLEGSSVKILTWNAFLVPKLKSHLKKLSEIADLVKQYDIVALNEVFQAGDIEYLKKELSHVYQEIHTGPAASLTKTSSGLILFSKFPIEKIDCITYSKGTGTDFFARKGVLYARIVIPQSHTNHSTPQKLNIIMTHTQANISTWEKFLPVSWGKNDYNIRSEQFDQLNEFIIQYDNEFPTLLLGDLNVQGDGDEYSKIMNMFENYNDIWRQTHPHKNGYSYNPSHKISTAGADQRIDYILIKDQFQSINIKSINLDKMTSTFNSNIQERQISDHYGLYTELYFTNGINRSTSNGK